MHLPCALPLCPHGPLPEQVSELVLGGAQGRAAVLRPAIQPSEVQAQAPSSPYGASRQGQRRDGEGCGCPGPERHPCRKSTSGRRLTPELSQARLNHTKRSLWTAGDPSLQGVLGIQVNHTVRTRSLYKSPQPAVRGAPKPLLQGEGAADPQPMRGKERGSSMDRCGSRCQTPKTRELHSEPRPPAFQQVTRNRVTGASCPDLGG